MVLNNPCKYNLYKYSARNTAGGGGTKSGRTHLVDFETGIINRNSRRSAAELQNGMKLFSAHPHFLSTEINILIMKIQIQFGLNFQ